MPILADFRCPECRTVHESWTGDHGLAAMGCPNCGHAPLVRLIGGAKIDHINVATDGVQSSDGMTTSIDRWDRMRRKQMEIEKRNMRNHGDYY